MTTNATSGYETTWTLAEWRAVFPNDPSAWTLQQRQFAHPIAGQRPAAKGKAALPPGLTAAQARAVTQQAAPAPLPADPKQRESFLGSFGNPLATPAQPGPVGGQPANDNPLNTPAQPTPGVVAASHAPGGPLNPFGMPNDNPTQTPAQVNPNGTLGGQANPAIDVSNVQPIAAQQKDPTGTGGAIGKPPPAAGSSHGSTHALTRASSRDADAPVGIPLQQHNQQTTNPDGSVSTTTTYSTTYIPRMWIKHVGPEARAANRPFDPNPNSPGSDLPHKIVHSNGTVTYDWYRQRDVYGPASLDPSQIQAIQEKLVAAGLLDPSTVHMGLWDAPDQAAYLTVLGQANLNGIDSWTMLGYMAQHPNMPQIKLDSPVTVGAALMAAEQSLLNRKATQGEQDAFVKAWDAVQSQGESVPPSVGPIQSLPSVNDFAQQYVNQNFGGEEKGQGLLHGLSLVSQQINASAGSGMPG